MLIDRLVQEEKKTTIDEDKQIIEEFQKNKQYTASDISINLKTKNIDISKSTVVNRLISLGYSYKQPPQKPFLSDEQKLRRFEWAKKNINTDWSNIAFSDETSIWNSSSGRRRWTANTNDYDKCFKYPLKVHLWGIISKQNIRFHIFEGIMDSVKYGEILHDYILDLSFDNPLFIFQDDNDPKHRSKYITNLKNSYNINSFDWPSNSPDLNPIENVWPLIKSKISKNNTSTKDGFKKNIQTECDKIDMNIINNLIDGMSKRIEKLIENKGNYINY